MRVRMPSKIQVLSMGTYWNVSSLMASCATIPPVTLEMLCSSAPAARETSAEIFEEIGDLLFAAANLARKLDVDAEAALRAANAKFERRFRAMESLAAKRGQVFAELNLAAQESLWQAVKRGE